MNKQERIKALDKQRLMNARIITFVEKERKQLKKECRKLWELSDPSDKGSYTYFEVLNSCRDELRFTEKTLKDLVASQVAVKTSLRELLGK